MLSFDEVFKLPDTSGSGGGSSVSDDIENLIAGLGSLGDSLIPDIPDFSDYIKDFTDSLFGGLEGGIIDKLASTSIGALIGGGLGAIIGGILGGPAGAKIGAAIGALAGGIVGWLWEELDGAMSNSIAGLFAGFGGAISKALTGAGAASLGTIIKNAFATGGFSGMFNAVAGVIKTTGLKALLKGGVIGAAVGLFVDGLAHLLWTALDDKFASADAETAKIGQTIGSVLGAIIGGILAGPAGAIIGSAIGTFAAGFVGLFWEPIKEYFDPKNNALSAFFVSVGSDIKTWATDTLISLGLWWSDSYLGFSTWWAETTEGFATWWTNTFGRLTSWYNDTIAIFTDWGSINGETLGNWWSSTTEGFTNWWTETKEGFATWKSNTAASIASWIADNWNGLFNWVGETLFMIDSWKSRFAKVIIDWCKGTVVDIGIWISDTIKSFGAWAVEAAAKILDFKTNAAKFIVGFVAAAAEALNKGLTDMYTNIATKIATAKAIWNGGWSAIKAAFLTWWKDLRETTKKKLVDAIEKPISDFFGVDNFMSIISDKLSAIKSKISSWWNSIKSMFSNDNAIDVDVALPNTKSLNAPSGASAVTSGHASGGIFNREHIARFAEGNKAEAIIPLENESAMRPFVDAISNGITASLMPLLATAGGSQEQLPPVYVGTLIADDNGLKELERKMRIIRVKEERRGV